MPPPLSSLAPTVYPHSGYSALQWGDISMGSTRSLTTTGTGSSRKRKFDATGGTRPPSSKRTAKSKTSDVDPVIISNNLNSTLNRMVEVMEKSLDATSVTGPATPISQIAQLPSMPEDIIQQAVMLTTTDGFLMEDELFAASIFFNDSSEDALRAARIFVALGTNWAVQLRFLLDQLNKVGLLPGKGKEKENDNGSMMY
jgi:hypothetical protein